MSEFETIFIPMGMNENGLTPVSLRGVDGLWVTEGVLNDSLRIDPVNPLQADSHLFDQIVFEIDYIRIREDFRLDFNRDSDMVNLGSLVDITGYSVADGFFSYSSAEDPSMGFLFDTGVFENPFFSRFIFGMDNTDMETGTSEVGILFNNYSAVDGLIPEGGNLQVAQMSIPINGRQDTTGLVDEMTEPVNEWSNSGEAIISEMRIMLPLPSDAGYQIHVDYVGLTPENPYGPSLPMYIMPTNVPPTAVIGSDPDPSVVQLMDGSAQIVLNASNSDDGNEGSQGLSFDWTKSSGPAGESFSSMNQEVITITFTEFGEYVFQLEVDDGDAYFSSATDTITVTVEEAQPEPEPELYFLRGDANSNGKALEVSDAITIIRYVVLNKHYQGRSIPMNCLDAADLDDDGSVVFKDGLLVLRMAFFTPVLDTRFFSGCVVDLTEDDLPECNYPADICLNGEEEYFHRKFSKKKYKKKKSDLRKKNHRYNKKLEARKKKLDAKKKLEAKRKKKLEKKRWRLKFRRR